MALEIVAGVSMLDLAAWVEAELGGVYERETWEFTVLMYYEAEKARGLKLSKRQAAYRLDRLVDLGRLQRKMERINGQEQGIYWRPGDVPEEVEDGA